MFSFFFPHPLKSGKLVTGTSKAWLGRFGEIGHPVDTSLFANKAYVQQILGAGTTGYSLTYTATWASYTNQIIVASPFVVQDYLLYEMKFADYGIEFNPYRVICNTTMNMSATVNVCTNDSYQGNYSGSVTFNQTEAILNGAEASKSLSFNMAMNTSVIFKLTETSLNLIWRLTGATMASPVGDGYRYTMNSGSANITIKLFT